MKKNKKRNNNKIKEGKKALPISRKNGIILCVIGGIVLLVGAYFLHRAIFPPKIIGSYRPPSVTLETVSRTEAGQDENKDLEYYEKQVRDIFYTYAGSTTLITDDNYAQRNDQGKFFKEFIDSIKEGNWEAYQAFFAEGYFDHNETKENMTPQLLYDIEVSYNSESKDITLAGKTYDVENFTVKYKILANDGTYRNDLPSEVWKPQVYQVAKTETGYCIVNIINKIAQ